MKGIYKITNPSGKVYIGQSWDIKQRWGKYKSELAKGQPALNRSFLKYSYDAHRFEILVAVRVRASITQQELDSLEIYWISVYKAAGFKLLNVKEGGSAGKQTPKSIAKMKYSLSLRREEFAERARIQMSKRSFEEKQKLGKANKGRNLGNQHAKGHKHTPEALEKIRLAGINRSVETRKKNSVYMKWLWAKRKEERCLTQ